MRRVYLQIFSTTTVLFIFPIYLHSLIFKGDKVQKNIIHTHTIILGLHCYFDSGAIFHTNFQPRFCYKSAELVTRNVSRVAQWKRAGPITQRSVDRNHALLEILFFLITSAGIFTTK